MKPNRCVRCGGWMVTGEVVETTDGPWTGGRCLLCGFVEDALMQQHRRARPEPYGVLIVAGHVAQRRQRAD